MSNKVLYSAFSAAKLRFENPVEKTVRANPQSPQQGAGTKYKEIPIKYNYGPEGQDICDEFLMEWPELYSSSGLQEKPGMSGRPEFSIMVSLPMDKPETARLVQVLGETHQSCANFIGTVKGQLGMPKFQANMADAMGFKNPVHQPIDKLTSEPIPGRNPSMFLKCFQRGPEQTLFHRAVQKTDPKTGQVVINPATGNPAITYVPIDWELVKGSEIKFIPLVYIKKIYNGGGKCSLQMEVKSAVVTSIIPRGSSSLQLDTMERLTSENPNMMADLDEQIARLMSMKSSLMERKLAPPPGSLSNNLPSASMGSMDQIDALTGAPPSNAGNPGYAPNSAAGTTQSSFADFAANTATQGVINIPNPSGARPVVAPAPISLSVIKQQRPTQLS